MGVAARRSELGRPLLTRPASHLGDDEGIIAVVVAAFAVVMFVFAALVVDLGMARMVRTDAQNASDASALAAANTLYEGSTTPRFDAAVAAAKVYAAKNVGTTTGDWTACSSTSALAYVPPGSSSCISFDSATTPSEVRVQLPARRVNSYFGALVGYDGRDVTAVAQASVSSPAGPDCTICVLGTGSQAVQNGRVAVTDGDLRFGGSVVLGGSGQLATTGGTTYLGGTVNRPGQVVGPLVQGGPVVVDPLAALAAPTTSGLPPRADPCTDGPGRYGAVTISGSGTCVLAPGLYVFTDRLSVTGTGKLLGVGVTLFFSCGSVGGDGPCSSDPSPGELSLSMKGTVGIAAPTSGTLQGQLIVYARDNLAPITLGDVGTYGLGGAVYAPSSRIDVTSQACLAAHLGILVARDVELAGANTCLTTRHVAGFVPPLPPTAAGLVE